MSADHPAEAGADHLASVEHPAHAGAERPAEAGTDHLASVEHPAHAGAERPVDAGEVLGAGGRIAADGVGGGADLPVGAPYETPPDAPAPVPVPIDDPATREGDGGMPPDTLPPPIGG
ncbi:hypothetical protein [Streptomyces cyaneofuscatus]|uniref:hypothetical protein n=1 Tax=Streptomyces cyaneofuscatus TaxID=66883 RepID=UPI0033B74F26